MNKLFCGDNLEILKTFPNESIDALITDPPAGIQFMGKDWDSNKGGRQQWIDWLSGVMVECKRTMKPGAHGLVWALPRTSHWTATRLEDAGFEIRDVVTHLFGTGFPKSTNIAKALDGVLGKQSTNGFNMKGEARKGQRDLSFTAAAGYKFKPTTEEAKQWEGWGTALKPASEHWILIRKPLAEKTIAANVLKYGTGAINIDGCRIGNVQGRWPANLTLDEEAASMLDEQSGYSKSGAMKHEVPAYEGDSVTAFLRGRSGPSNQHGDSGGASRFFYVAKPSNKEKNVGCEDLPDRLGGSLEDGNDKRKGGLDGVPQLKLTKNNHPTVKPIALMQYFIKLITPPNGVVLDPFCGSGTTIVAREQLGFDSIGIDISQEYIDIASQRITNTKTIA